MLSQERLKELLDYDPSTGIFQWKVDRGGMRAGDVAGLLHTNGYIRISVDSRRYYAHRLAFLFMEGEFPPEQVDHIDLSRTNNAWSNLRRASVSENMHNREIRSHSTIGFKGVSKNKVGYMARIRVDKRVIYLGNFKTREEASEAYNKAANDLVGAFARVGNGTNS
ncbi:HNH endonuclease [Sinorhizobium medicae]|nr:HNH endonuclease [Sinorhizobium medicae]